MRGGSVSARIPELQKLKERIIELPDEDAAALRVWFEAVLDVRAEEKRRIARKSQQPKIQQSSSEEKPNEQS